MGREEEVKLLFFFCKQNKTQRYPETACGTVERCGKEVFAVCTSPARSDLFIDPAAAPLPFPWNYYHFLPPLLNEYAPPPDLMPA